MKQETSSNQDRRILRRIIDEQAILTLIAQIDFKLPKRILLPFDTMFYWRQSTRDGIYNPAGILLRPGSLSGARYVGTQPSAQVVWAINRHFTFLANYTRFFAGKFLKETPPGKDIDYFTTWLSFKF